MKKLIRLITRFIGFSLLGMVLLHLVFLVWLSNFSALDLDSSSREIGYLVAPDKVLLYLNTSPVALMLNNNSQSYRKDLLRIKEIDQNYLCITLNNNLLFRTKIACRVTDSPMQLLDSLFCSSPLASFYMVKSCKNKVTSNKTKYVRTHKVQKLAITLDGIKYEELK